MAAYYGNPGKLYQKQYTGTDQNTVDHCNYFSAADYFYCNLFSRKLTSRIAALSYAMESFHLGHDPEHLSIITLPHPADASNYDEIDNLGITFEDMQHTIAQNLKSIVSLSINEERLKYQLLQSQINPHFLYNILGTIRTCQALGKLDIADQMLTNLTAFLPTDTEKIKRTDTDQRRAGNCPPVSGNGETLP